MSGSLLQGAFELGSIEADYDTPVDVRYRDSHLAGFADHFLSPALVGSHIVFIKTDIPLLEPVLDQSAV